MKRRGTIEIWIRGMYFGSMRVDFKNDPTSQDIQDRVAREVPRADFLQGLLPSEIDIINRECV